MPWAVEGGTTNDQGGTDTYDEMQKIIYDRTLQFSDEIGFLVAPIGWAWNTVLKEKNYPLHYLHIHDRIHPSIKGAYLTACVIFATVFQESVQGLPYYGGMEKEEAIYLQKTGCPRSSP